MSILGKLLCIFKAIWSKHKMQYDILWSLCHLEFRLMRYIAQRFKHDKSNQQPGEGMALQAADLALSLLTAVKGALCPLLQHFSFAHLQGAKKIFDHPSV